MAVRPSERAFVFQIECGSFAVDHFAVLRDRNINVGAAFGNLLPGSGHYEAKFLGHQSDRAATRCDQINRLPLVVVRKRTTLTSFHPTPPGSSSLLSRRRFRRPVA